MSLEPARLFRTQMVLEWVDPVLERLWWRIPASDLPSNVPMDLDDVPEILLEDLAEVVKLSYNRTSFRYRTHARVNIDAPTVADVVMTTWERGVFWQFIPQPEGTDGISRPLAGFNKSPNVQTISIDPEAGL